MNKFKIKVFNFSRPGWRITHNIFTRHLSHSSQFALGGHATPNATGSKHSHVHKQSHIQAVTRPSSHHAIQAVTRHSAVDRHTPPTSPRPVASQARVSRVRGRVSAVCRWAQGRKCHRHVWQQPRHKHICVAKRRRATRMMHGGLREQAPQQTGTHRPRNSGRHHA